MKKSTLLMTVLCFLGLNTALAQEMNVKNDKVKVEFYVVSDKQEGTIGGFESTIHFDPASPTTASIKGSVDVKTIDTGSKTRDEHLISDDYFNAEKYPKMYFESKSVESTKDGYKMEGTMTIKGVEKPVTFNFTFENSKFSGKTTIYGKDFNIGHSWKSREDSKIYIKINIPVA